ncbi:MAG TPA: FimV/HubP family polar landmark protein [Steroidobacteraceae bacterium]
MDPKLLLLSLALPGASLALGLGDIRVESALNQPLAAQIDLLGAAPDELTGLHAAIADPETFQRHGLDRAPYLSAIALTVSQDKQGHPVLLLRTTEPLNEPLVTFLVDLRTPAGHLLREYNLLLDPAVPAPARTDATLVPAPVTAASAPLLAEIAAQPAPMIIMPPEPVIVTLDSNPQINLYTVEHHDTLDRIVRLAGANSRSDRHRMMLAIFRANPDAFQANLNLLRSGATLHLPSMAEVAAISGDDADREFVAQLAGWRAASRRTRPASPAAIAVAGNRADAGNAEAKATEPSVAELSAQVESLQKSLEAMTQQIKQLPAMPSPEEVAAEALAAARPPTAITTSPQPSKDLSAKIRPSAMRYAPIAAGLGFLVAAGAWFFRRRSENTGGAQSLAEPMQSPLLGESSSEATATGGISLPFAPSPSATSLLVEESAREATPAGPIAAPSETSEVRRFGSAQIPDPPDAEPTVNLAGPNISERAATLVLAPRVEVNDDTVEHNFAFFNPESAVNTTHVMIASGLHQRPAFVERRKSPVDVLRQAIEREPHRSDLRLKLLELYYSAASQNRRAFLEIVRHLAKDPQLIAEKEWAQIAEMGRLIAPDDELFAADNDHQAVA